MIFLRDEHVAPQHVARTAQILQVDRAADACAEAQQDGQERQGTWEFAQQGVACDGE